MCNSVIRHVSPESVGIRSEAIEAYIHRLESLGSVTHSLILARGNHIFFEHYWEPFDREFLHRMYSVTKSFVSLAIGFLVQDGCIDLDDPISKYFAEDLKGQPDPNIHNQTIRHMLMMSTAKIAPYWFNTKPTDRVREYFQNPSPISRPSGTIFEYDSTGSFIMGALVERITGKSLMDYLQEKLFKEIGVSERAYMLKCPGGHSWSDSALVARTMDLFLTARFVLNGGSWNGKQLLNADYIRAATSKQIDNNFQNMQRYDTQGYGYQFWMTYQDSFCFNGMGAQFAICVPKQDLILVINADNQGKERLYEDIFSGFFELIVNPAADPLPENTAAQASLQEYAKTLKLAAVAGDTESEWMARVHGVTYRMGSNPMGITRLKLTFADGKGCLSYTNAQGDKELFFGMGYNEFGLFPQEGYADQIGTVYAPGNYYRCAASAAWVNPGHLRLFVQIIDQYFGTLSINLSFRDNVVGLYMTKVAEDFLQEYYGYAGGTAEQ